MNEKNTLKVREKTAHLLNALRLNEQLLEEVYDAFCPEGEDAAHKHIDALTDATAQIREIIDRWIVEGINDWAISRPEPDEV